MEESSFCIIALGLIAVVLVAECSPNECESPGTPAFAYRKGGCCQVGSVVHYKCHTGYKLIGKAKITCNDNGEWSAETPRCEELKNDWGVGGYIFSSEEDSNTINSIDYYDSMETYYNQYDGSYTDYPPPRGDRPRETEKQEMVTDYPTTALPSRTELQKQRTQKQEIVTDYPTTTRPSSSTELQKQRTQRQRRTTTSPWTQLPTKFSRDTDCGQRPDVQNTKPEQPIKYGNETVYECVDGYVLIDTRFGSYKLKLAEMMTCGEDGTWHGDIPVCKELTCSLKRGSRLIKRTPPRKTSFKAGDTVSFKCARESYRLVGKSDITCSDRAAGWTSRQPKCLLIKCPRTKLENGVVFNPKEHYQNSQTYECYMGFELRGPTNRTCMRNGKWSGPAPVCLSLSRDIYRECPRLPTPDGGYQELDGVRPGSTATFSCGDGLYLRGDQTRVCLAEGYWSGTQPTCDGENSFDMPDESAERIITILDRLQLRRPESSVDRELKKTLHEVEALGTEMYFAVDASGSIDVETFNATLKVILAIIEKLDVNNGLPGGNKMGLLTFDHNEHIIIPPNVHSNMNDIREKIEALTPTLDGGTCMTCVLNKIKAMMYQSKTLYRQLKPDGSSNVPAYADRNRVVFIFTDGNYNMGGRPEKMYAGDPVQQEYLDVVMVGIGGDVNRRFLERMATSHDNVHILPDYMYLNKLATTLSAHIPAFDECGVAGDFLSQRTHSYKFTKASEDAWPWVAALFVNRYSNPQSDTNLADKMNSTSGFERSCSGALIDLKWVMTIKSCVNDINKDNIFVQLGARTEERHYTNQYRNIMRKENVPDSNLVLLRLEERVVPTAYVRPVCLPEHDNVESFLQDKHYGFLSGWTTYLKNKKQPLVNGHLSQRLVYNDVRPLLDKDTCKNFADEKRAVTFNMDTDICAGRLNEDIEDCKTLLHSGEPLMTDKMDQTSKFYLTGMLRYAMSCSALRYPDVGIYEILSKTVLKNIHEIVDNVQNNNV